MEPQLAKLYAALIEKRQGPADLVELAAGIFHEIVGERIGNIALSDFVNAIAAAFNSAGPKAPWVSRREIVLPGGQQSANGIL